jgi:prefoldin subunit 2
MAAADAHRGVDPQTALNLMREQCTDLSVKINSLDLDKTEHELVLKALQPLPADRKCFRMIGSVVVERTVAEVLPAVQKNHDQV